MIIMTIKSTIYYCALFIQEHKIIIIEEIKFNSLDWRF